MDFSRLEPRAPHLLLEGVGFVLEPLRKTIATCDFQGESVQRPCSPYRLLPMNILDVFFI